MARRRPSPVPPVPPVVPVRPVPSVLPVLVFLVALAVRLIHLSQLRASPFFDVLLGDAHGYDAWAQRLAAGDWIGRDVFYQAPLYPYVLGAIYAVAGRDLLVARVVQAVIGAGSCTALALAASRLFGARAGLIAGLALALYAPAIFFDLLLQKAVLDVFFVCLALWLLARTIPAPDSRLPAPGSRLPVLWLAIGLTMGALSLTRENALVLVLVVAAWAVRGEGPGVGNRESGVGRRKRLIAFAAGLSLVLLPVAARNYAVGGGFHLTTSQFGPNFYIGNHAGSDGTYVSLRPGRGAPEFERQDATELAERAEGRPLNPAEVSGYWTNRAMAFVTSDPGAWLRLLARKAALLVNTSEMLDTESQESYAEVSWPLRVLGGAGHFGVLVPLAALGVWTLWPDRRRLWVFFLLPAAYGASVVLFYVFARYRVALVPFLVLFASAGLAGARAWTGRASRRELAAAALALAALAAFVNRPLLSSARMRAITETNLGASLQEAGRLDAAVARYERAIAIQPDYAPAYNNLGLALAAQGRLEEAASRFQSAVSAAPSQASAHRHLGSVQATLGRTADALASLARAVALDPTDVDAHYDLGSLLLDERRFTEAADQFRAVLDVTPDHVRAINNLGIALASQGRLDEALAAFERAVQLQPDFADALKNLEKARRALRRP